MIKDIVVSLALGSARDPACDYANSVAQAFQAHLAGIAFAYEPVIPPSVMGAMPLEYIDEQREENEKAAEAALARFEQAATRSGISFERHRPTESPAGAADLFGQIARVFDLAVVGQTEGDNASKDLIIESALFETGRPVIVVPYIQKDLLKLDQVMVCWDGSRTAARAVADSLPLLRRAKNVDVVAVSKKPVPENEIPGADIAAHLARHGVKVEVERIVTDIDVASTLLSYAADSTADFLVMGAYGHSRLREFILGGVTRGMLQSMTVPVLMSH